MLVILALSGCSGDDPVTPDTTPESNYVWPDTREKLMANFERAYSEMDFDEYANCLHPEFKFIFADGITSYERQDDLDSTQNMFAGNPPENPTFIINAGVQSITINTLVIASTWVHEPETNPLFPDSWKALYNASLRFYLDGGTNTITVSSQQQFYIRSEEVDQGDGTTRTRFYLFGQEDLDDLLKNEDTTWGAVKAIWL
jgi:hypothetical protein